MAIGMNSSIIEAPFGLGAGRFGTDAGDPAVRTEKLQEKLADIGIRVEGCGAIPVALDPAIAPGVGTPVPGGLTYRKAHLALEMIADSARMLSMDVVEVNPMLDAQNLTVKVALV